MYLASPLLLGTPETGTVVTVKVTGDDTKGYTGTKEGTYTYTVKETKGQAGGITYDEYYQGYTYGPDAVVANLKAGWTTADLRLSVEGSFFFMVRSSL